jgi:TetR/AcrR family transcriptional regulator, transcriptional repressor for nem operon
MARPKSFDKDLALQAAIGVFREHGFEGSSTDMLIKAMGIGRQSFYDTFGDKLKLYHAALGQYDRDEGHKHLTTLRSSGRGLDAIQQMLRRVVAEAYDPCLGVGSVCEFGTRDPEVTAINDATAGVLHRALTERLEEARADGELAADVTPEEAAHFVFSSIANLRIAARGGASEAVLEAIGRLSLRSLR